MLGGASGLLRGRRLLSVQFQQPARRMSSGGASDLFPTEDHKALYAVGGGLGAKFKKQLQCLDESELDAVRSPRVAHTLPPQPSQ